jgi:hypothetical protein
LLFMSVPLDGIGRKVFAEHANTDFNPGK